MPTSTPTDPCSGGAEHTAREKAAEQVGATPNTLVLENSARLGYQCVTDRTVCHFKYSSGESLVSILVDEDGAEVKLADEVKRDIDACEKKRGKMSAALDERTLALPESHRLDVALTLGSAYLVPLKEFSLDPASSHPLTPEGHGAVIARLRAAGAGDFHSPGAGNLLFGTMTAGAIRAMAFSPDFVEVQSIAEDPPARLLLSIARQATGANLVFEGGLTGKGSRIAVIEMGEDYGKPIRPAALFPADRAEDNNPHLACVKGLGRFAGEIAATDHISLVIANLCGDDAVLRGVAPRVEVFAGGGRHLHFRVIDSLIGRYLFGAKIFNHSYAGEDVNSQVFDLMSYDDTLSVAASGNFTEFAGNDSFVTDPAIGYNVLGVGGVLLEHPFDRTQSAIQNDPQRIPASVHGDRYAKPEISAPSHNLASHLAQWSSAQKLGTSFASPYVAGTAALIREVNPKMSPWAVKALLMASAVQTVPKQFVVSERGLPRKLDVQKTGIKPRFEAGIGFVDVGRAIDLAKAKGGSVQEIAIDGCAVPKKSFELKKGQRGRVVIAWDSHPFFAQRARRPSSDIDLTVRAPSGSTVARSVTFDNTVEAVDFIASESGAYEVSMPVFDCESGEYGPSRLALAVFSGTFDKDEKARGVSQATTFIRGPSRLAYKRRSDGTGEVTVYLRRVWNQAALANQKLQVKAAGNDTILGEGTTNDSGLAVIKLKGLAKQGAQSIVVTFAGAKGASASAVTFDTIVDKVGTKLSQSEVVPEEVKPGEKVTLAFALTDEAGNPVANRRIRWKLLRNLRFPATTSELDRAAYFDAETFSGVTGKDGKLVVQYKVPIDAVSDRRYLVHVVWFAGDASYKASQIEGQSFYVE